MLAQKAKGFFYRVLCGFFLGISIIAPGVSGSVMAIMMGIYDKLISIVANPFKGFKRNVIYLIPMGIGALFSILIFAQLFKLLFELYPTPGYLLFMGLIGGSLPAVYDEARKGAFKWKYCVAAVITLSLAIVFGILERVPIAEVVNSNNYYLALCGLLGGVASIIPGMSVSMLLMVLGVYTTLLNAVTDMNIMTLLPAGICFVLGMVLFSNLIKFIFKRFRTLAYYLVLGFMAGSIISIFPGLPTTGIDWLLSFVALGAGLGISLLFQYLGGKFNASHEE